MTQEPTETDVATAFESLRREVSLTRAAVEGLTAARERVPDYSTTLGAMVDGLKKVAGVAARIEASPAVQLTPAAMGEEMAKASVAARSADSASLREAAAYLSRSCAQIDLMIKRGQAADQQWKYKVWCVAGGLLGGILLWSFLPGALARSLPAEWAVPERLAAGMMATDRWDGGQRMMQTANPHRWQGIVDAANQRSSNRSAEE